jgi:transposase-like protein
MMTVRQCVRYSTAFKREVIGSIESGRFGSLTEAARHFGIRGNTTLRRWLVQFGKNRLVPKVVRVQNPEEQSELAALRAEVKQLKEALGDAYAEKLLGNAYFDLLCKKYGEDPLAFKKKIAAKPSTAPLPPPSKPRHHRRSPRR